MTTLELLHPITISQFGKSREISTIYVLQKVIDEEKKTVKANVSNKTSNPAEVQFATVLTLWRGEAKEGDAPELAGSYYADSDTTPSGMDARIKAVMDKLYNR